MGKPWARIGQEGKKTALTVGRHEMFASTDSLLLHVLWLAFLVIASVEDYRHHQYSWLHGLMTGFLSCLLLPRLVLRIIHRRRTQATDRDPRRNAGN